MAGLNKLGDHHETLGLIRPNLQLLPENACVLVCVSGGCDSVFLLNVLAFLCDQGGSKPVRLEVIHFNHGLRGAESDGDAKLVRALAGELRLPYHEFGFSWQTDEPKSQAVFREKRQAVLQQFIDQDESVIFAFGHHLNDQAETVLARILRGCGVHGLQGMRVFDGRNFRPLLGVQGSQIRSIALQTGMQWREDASNQDEKYERNWLRHTIMPQLEERRGAVAEKLAALAEDAQAYEEVEIDIFADAIQIENYSVWRVRDFARILKRGFFARQFGVSRKESDQIYRLVKKGNGRFSCNGFIVEVSQDLVCLKSRTAELQVEQNEGRFRSVLGEWRFHRDAGALVRARRKGDGKKIKKALIDARLPRFFRSEVPVLCTQDKTELMLPDRFDKMGAMQVQQHYVEYCPSTFARRLYQLRDQ